MTFAPRSFKKMFSENLRDIASWRALVIPLAVFLPILLNHPSESIGVVWHLVTSPFAWVIYLVLFVFDALIRAAYWHIRERNSNYIKKMEEYDRKKHSLQSEITDEKKSS